MMTQTLRCIIVDDEDGAHLVIGHYLKDVKSLKLCGDFYNAIDAMDFLHHHEVDLIFLDINMPGLSGMEMLAAMTKPPLVILTTAHTEYALEGYKYQVVDYLVKPIGLPQFMAAIDKVFSRLVRVPLNSAGEKGQLTLKVDGDMIKVKTDEISHIQSWGNYVKVFTNQGIYLSQMTTAEILSRIDPAVFFRIHKSYIISLARIIKITGNEVYLDNDVILPVGNTFRRELLEKFK